MKAIILNSGIGKRLRPFTDKNPKCFIKINGKFLLQRQIESLMHFGITDIIITTGQFEEKIKSFIRDNFPNISVKYVKNPDYKRTNYIYSLWLTRKLIDDDIILMHGDMIFDEKLLRRLINTKHKNSVLVNGTLRLTKDFKARIVNNIVKEIGIDISAKNAFFLAPIYKFSYADFKIWINEIGKFVKKKELSVYAEDAFNNISDKIELKPLYYNMELCMEIDNQEDLNIAKKRFM